MPHTAKPAKPAPSASTSSKCDTGTALGLGDAVQVHELGEHELHVVPPEQLLRVLACHASGVCGFAASAARRDSLPSLPTHGGDGPEDGAVGDGSGALHPLLSFTAQEAGSRHPRPGCLTACRLLCVAAATFVALRPRPAGTPPSCVDENAGNERVAAALKASRAADRGGVPAASRGFQHATAVSLRMVRVGPHGPRSMATQPYLQTPEAVAAYLAARAEQDVSASTLKAACAAIGAMHRDAVEQDPTAHEHVRRTLAGATAPNGRLWT